MVKIRDPDAPKESRYKQVFSDRATIYPGREAIRPGWLLIIGEGELDALLLGQELDDLAAVVTLGSSSAQPGPDILMAMLVAPVWYTAHDADKAGDLAASKWPPRARRVRPPDGVKDWTELWQSGFNSIRYHWGRYLPMSLPWEVLASQRWGPALTESQGAAAAPDSYAAAERRAIQSDTLIDMTAD
jgi:hypothetical protein